MADLIQATPRGLFCEAGGFHIDPWEPVDRAVITHAHSDHARPGCGCYLAAGRGADILRLRLGPEADVRPAAWGTVHDLNGVRVSLHPAGHLLGSAQVRVEHGGQVWVVSGDYKTASDDTTCDAFELVRCDTFITESTFGLPIYRWKPQAAVFDEINTWWRKNQVNGRTSVIYAYALGKAQRVLSGLDPTIGPIVVHGAVLRFVQAYRDAGIGLPPVLHADDTIAREIRGRGMVVAPPSAAGSPWLRRFGTISPAMASGWMQVRGTRRRRSLDRGFVLSDHADWPGLLQVIRDTGASRVGVTHGYAAPLVRWLREHGTNAWSIPTCYVGERDDSEP
jgi:putative mRNA 3-end processing factor